MFTSPQSDPMKKAYAGIGAESAATGAAPRARSFAETPALPRREFLQRVVLGAAGLALANRAARAASGAAAPQPTLAWGQDADYEALVAKVLAPLGGIGAFVKQGQRVVVKPNIGWDRTPAQAANTHPLVVKALVQLALGAGAARVLVFDRPCNDARRTYANSGIQAAVAALQSKRATCAFMDERKFILVNIRQGQAVAEWKFYQDALEADCYINVPVAKHHGLSQLTLGLKNTMGVLGGDRGNIHPALAQKLADINTVIRPKLTVIDATRILLRHGPQGGKLEDVKTLNIVLASADPVAADAYATTLFDLPPDALESTRSAAAMGLGEMDLKKVRIMPV